MDVNYRESTYSRMGSLLTVLIVSTVIGLCAWHVAEAQSVSKETVVEIQNKLTSLGYDLGSPDGICGKRTVRALNKFMLDNNTNKVNYCSKKALENINSIIQKNKKSGFKESWLMKALYSALVFVGFIIVMGMFRSLVNIYKKNKSLTILASSFILILVVVNVLEASKNIFLLSLIFAFLIITFGVLLSKYIKDRRYWNLALESDTYQGYIQYLRHPGMKFHKRSARVKSKHKINEYILMISLLQKNRKSGAGEILLDMLFFLRDDSSIGHLSIGICFTHSLGEFSSLLDSLRKNREKVRNELNCYESFVEERSVGEKFYKSNGEEAIVTEEYLSACKVEIDKNKGYLRSELVEPHVYLTSDNVKKVEEKLVLVFNKVFEMILPEGLFHVEEAAIRDKKVSFDVKYSVEPKGSTQVLVTDRATKAKSYYECPLFNLKWDVNYVGVNSVSSVKLISAQNDNKWSIRGGMADVYKLMLIQSFVDFGKKILAEMGVYKGEINLKSPSQEVDYKEKRDELLSEIRKEIKNTSETELAAIAAGQAAFSEIYERNVNIIEDTVDSLSNEFDGMMSGFSVEALASVQGIDIGLPISIE